MRSAKKWLLITMIELYTALIVLGGITFIIDPFFHYHAPLKQLQYPINNERYQNDGIVKHFTYDAVITGTSMTENFKASEFDRLFGTNSVKVPFYGAHYKETSDNLKRAIQYNPEIRYILYGLDYNKLLFDKDTKRFGNSPEYLYDENFFNDVYYLLNKDVLFHKTLPVISYTHSGGTTTDFDTYCNWMSSYTFGKAAVDKTYERAEKAESSIPFTLRDQEIVEETLDQNVISLAAANPHITFYLFFTPYSIYYWDSLNQTGELERQLKAERTAIEQMLDYDNIQLYSFFDNFELICDLNNYKDSGHYGEDVNTQILQWIYDKEHLLTKDNYLEYCKRIEEFYSTYNYNMLFDS